MEALRSATSANRGTIVNVVYVIAFLVILYYVYKFLTAGAGNELILVPNKIPATLPNGGAAGPFMFDKTSGARIMTGGEYTLSFWMYIKDWTVRGGMTKSVLQIVDAAVTKNYLLSVMIYPNEPKLMIRVAQDNSNVASGSSSTPDYTDVGNFKNLLGGSSTPSVNTSAEMPQCDLTDIDLQRWINITIVMNGRIMDVYYDGKLNRSCVLPNLPIGSEGTSQQALVTGQFGGFNGHISSVVFNGQALTPDRIYAIYQAGPTTTNGLLTYLANKFGINLQWYNAKNLSALSPVSVSSS